MYVSFVRLIVCEVLSHNFSLSCFLFIPVLFSSVYIYIYIFTRTHVKFVPCSKTPWKGNRKRTQPLVCVPAIPYSEQIARQIESTRSGKSVELFGRLEKAWTKCWRSLLIQYTALQLGQYPGTVFPKLCKNKIVLHWINLELVSPL
jgi:hypothetical protein